MNLPDLRLSSACGVIFRREFFGYMTSPMSFVFIVIFLMLAGFFTFELGNFYFRGQADLQPFFMYHPWLYLFLVPAISMRVWAEERKSGTIELSTVDIASEFVRIITLQRGFQASSRIITTINQLLNEIIQLA